MQIKEIHGLENFTQYL